MQHPFQRGIHGCGHCQKRKASIKINDTNPKRQNATGSYVLIGICRNTNGDTYIVRSIVNHFKNELSSMDVLYAVNAKKELAAAQPPRSTAKPLSVTSSTISISDFLDIVNQVFPDIFPEMCERKCWFRHNKTK